MSDNNKLKIGIYELTGCAGDALLIVDCEMELLDIFNAVDIQSFLMAKSDNIDGELDIALVEGSVSTEREIEELKDIRKRSSIVVAFGLCATVGGIQARFDEDEWARNLKDVYGDSEITHVKAVPSKPIDAYIDVDFYLPGCPVGKDQFLNFFTRAVQGSPPESYPVPVCVTCKYNENDCLLKKGIPCLGPLTADGCGSVCPNHGVPCYGCWGPAEGANLTSEFHLLQEKGFDIEAIQKRMSNYSGAKLQDFFEQFKNKEPK
jgi:sulfhydrogenase subunit delta